MKYPLGTTVGVLAIIFFCGAASAPGDTQGITGEPTRAQKDAAVTGHANGTFEVKLMPQPVEDKDAGIGRMSIDKQFHGDLEAVSKGEMLAALATGRAPPGTWGTNAVRGT